MSGKYGIMVHYLSHIANAEGKKELSVEEMADRFDVKSFADSIEKMGASWVIFPIGQNTGYYWSENPFIEERIQGRCTKRDLIFDLADELYNRGIKLIAYLPVEVDFQEEDIRKAFRWNESPDRKEFMKIWTSVVRYYAEKLGKRLNGWWFDGAYDAAEKDFTVTKDWNNKRFVKSEWFDAAKAGNSDAVISMNTGADIMGYVFEEEEYLGGEVNDLTHFPWDYESMDKQWHALTYLDCFWMLAEGNTMPEPRFTDDELCGYVMECLNKKGAVTLNIGIDENGILAYKTVEQICRLKSFLKSNS